MPETLTPCRPILAKVVEEQDNVWMAEAERILEDTIQEAEQVYHESVDQLEDQTSKENQNMNYIQTPTSLKMN